MNVSTASKQVRAMQPHEKRTLLKKHLILFPVLIVLMLIGWVLMIATNLMLPMRIGGGVILIAIAIILTRKQLLLQKEMNQGEVEEIIAEIEKKIKFGGGKGIKSGGTHHSRKVGQSGATYILVMGGEKYWVSAKIYSKAIEGAQMKMIRVPRSEYVVSLDRVNK